MPGEKVFSLKLRGKSRFVRLFGDSAKAKGLRSGFVVLGPGDSVGRHNSGSSEEVLIILDGKAAVSHGRKNKLAAQKNSFVYLPAQTAHNVTNIGRKPLKYVYVSARA